MAVATIQVKAAATAVAFAPGSIDAKSSVLHPLTLNKTLICYVQTNTRDRSGVGRDFDICRATGGVCHLEKCLDHRSKVPNGILFISFRGS